MDETQASRGAAVVRGDDLWVVVPARLSSLRFPSKPLTQVAGEPMVRQVVRRVLEATAGTALHARVLVATDALPIAHAVEDLCEVVVQSDALRTGTDRVWAACTTLRATAPSWIVNVQGDEPCLPPSVLRALIAQRIGSDADIVSACVPMHGSQVAFADSDVVKVVLGEAQRALLFSRAPIPHGASRWHWHIGVYAFTGASLQRFAALDSGRLEQLERLEQLRALEAGMSIEMAVLEGWADAVWPSVNRPGDVAAASEFLLARHHLSEGHAPSPPTCLSASAPRMRIRTPEPDPSTT